MFNFKVTFSLATFCFILYYIKAVNGGVFDVAEGRKITIEMFEYIAVLFGGDLEYASAINDAGTLDDLITAANDVLDDDQNENLEDMGDQECAELVEKLNSYMSSFNKLLKDSGNQSKTAPLTYLLDSLKDGKQS